MNFYRLGAILFPVLCFSLASSFSGYAQTQSTQKTLTTPVRTKSGDLLAPIFDGAVPIVFASEYLRQGVVDRTEGLLVKDHMWLVPGKASIHKTTRINLGIRGEFTRMTVDSTTNAVGMVTTYTLYVNGQRTRLACRGDNTGKCSVNANVPINVNDDINVAVHLPKTRTCAETGNGCGGPTPIITLMVRIR